MSKTVKVRIAVAVDPSGDWNAGGSKDTGDTEAFGWILDTLESGEARYILTAELPIPEAVEVQATVEKEEPSE